MTPRAQSALARFHRSEGGQAIFLVVLFFFLLAGLLFLILNTGEKLNHKVLMQSAADSVTATGAAWYARGLNTIAMCNVTELQLLSLIVLLDTLETVVPPSTECIDDLVANLSSTPHGSDVPIDDRLTWLVVGNARSEQEIIRQFRDVVAGIPMAEYLQYDTGVLWECTKLVDGFMHAMAEVTPLAAQREAMDMAEKTHAEFGFITPLWPELPIVDGKFRDFEEPMWYAQMPWDGNDAQPPCIDCLLEDRPPCIRHRRRRPTTPTIGAFAWVMNYRGYNGRVMGPYSYWREPFTNTRPMGLFDISRFSTLFRLVCAHKFSMMFGGTDDKVSLRDWEMDYDAAKRLEPDQIRRAWWESVSFDARHPFPQASFFASIELRDPERPTPRDVPYPDMRDPVSNFGFYTRATQSYEGTDPR
ncbi:MAG: hypothetical protein WBC59_02865, partial [Phycisphaerae bacterium]